jgi:hypothetical protein
MSRDELVILTLKDLRRAEAAYAGAQVSTDGQKDEAGRLRAERDGARLRYADALKLTHRRVLHRAA